MYSYSYRIEYTILNSYQDNYIYHYNILDLYAYSYLCIPEAKNVGRPRGRMWHLDIDHGSSMSHLKALPMSLLSLPLSIFHLENPH